jgi:hypothetical protein
MEEKTKGTISRGSEKTWEKSAGSQIILNSIFAVLGAAMIPAVVGDTSISSGHKVFEVSPCLLSFFLLAVSAEGAINAYDEKDVRKYVYYLLWYNVGVIFLGFGIAAIAWDHCIRGLVCSLSPVCRWTAWVAYMLAVFVFLARWLKDLGFLLSPNRSRFAEYLKELEDEVSPEPDHPFLMKLLGFVK